MKRFYAGLLALTLALTLSIPTGAAAYTDIPSASPLAEEVHKAVNYGLMNGYSANTFGYSDSMTRVQFATVLGRMMGWFDGYHTDERYITDVMAVGELSRDYLLAVEMAVRKDVADTDAAFRPNDAITRGEMSEMLVRALGLKGAAALAEKGSVLPFTDVAARRGYIAVAYAIGMTNGASATTFAPNSTATRAQAAAMLVRIYEKLHQKTNRIHGFYAISSYSQIGLASSMDRVSVGWSRMTWDGSAALLSTTNANGNEYAIPNGYADAVNAMTGTPLNLSVYMDTSDGLRELLASETGRAQAVEQIVAELSVSYNAIGENPYDGVTIDFEGLRSGQKSNFTAFLTELTYKVKALGKLVYVCVSPVLTTGSYYDGYDYRAIGQLADEVILMAYDYDAQSLADYENTEYHKTTAPAPIDQVYASLLAITDPETGVADVSKIALGFSNDPTAWQIDGSGKLVSGTPSHPSNDTVATRLAQSDTVGGWSSTYQMPYAIYTTADGSTYFLWYEDDASVSAKLNLAKLFGITDVSLWRLGTIPAGTGWNWNTLLR